jgi:aldehyde reductase
MAYSPLGNPSKPVTRVWDENAKTILQDEKLLAMAKKYNKTVAQICIRFGIQRGLILIPKVTFFIIRYFIFFQTTNPARRQENAEVFDFALESGEMDTISAMNQNFRVVELPQNVGVRYYPFVDNYSE